MRLRRTLRSTVALIMAFGGLGLVTATPATASPCEGDRAAVHTQHRHCG
ncbi:hypothetical protein ACIRBX_01080 [Kitasatospora sp. NPDC096147]